MSMERNERRAELVIVREFRASRELVYKAFTEGERLAQWWGPKGFDMQVKKLELRPGGMFLYSQRSPDGQVMWGKFVYGEIDPPEKLVYTNSFSDEEGRTVRAPFNDKWPLEIRNELTFAEKDGVTTLTMRGGPIGATEEENAVFSSMEPMLQKGFAGTLDQLGEYLARS